MFRRTYKLYNATEPNLGRAARAWRNGRTRLIVVFFKNLPRTRFPRRFFFSRITPSSVFSQIIITCIPILIPRTQLDTRRARIENEKRRLPSIRMHIRWNYNGWTLWKSPVDRTKIKEISLTDWRNRFFRQRTLRTSFELFIKIRCCSKRVWESIKKRKSLHKSYIKFNKIIVSLNELFKF